MKPTIPVIADVHHASTGRTDAVNDVEFPQREIGIRRPFVRHPADLHVLVRSIDSKGTTKGYTRKPSPSSSLSGHCLFFVRSRPCVARPIPAAAVWPTRS